MPESDPNSFGMRLFNFFTDFLGGAASKDPNYGAKRRKAQEDADRQKLEDAYRERQRKRLEQPPSFITSGMETEGTPPVTGVPFQGAETPSYEVPQTPAATRQGVPQVDWRGLTLQDIPTAVGLAKEFRGEEPEYGITRQGAIYIKKGKGAGTVTKEAPPAVKEDKAHGQPWPDAEGNMWQTFTSGVVKPVQTEAPAYPSGTPTLEDIPGQYFRPTKEMGEGKKLEQIKGKKTAGKGLHPIHEDRGDEYRNGTYNPETGEKIWENWTDKRLGPERSQKVSAQYDSWEKTIDRRIKQLGPKYKLSDQEMSAIDLKDPASLAQLFIRKGLSGDSAKKYISEVEELENVRLGGLQDIENSGDPYKRLKGIVGGTLGKKEVGKQLDEATARKFLEKAGGDKEKARKLARDEGYTF